MITILLPDTEDADALKRAICRALPSLDAAAVAALDKAGRDAAGVLRALMEARPDIKPEWTGGTR